MVLIWLGIVIGVLLSVILIVKISKTNPREIAGVEIHCAKCGLKTNGSECSRCKSNSFGV